MPQIVWTSATPSWGTTGRPSHSVLSSAHRLGAGCRSSTRCPPLYIVCGEYELRCACRAGLRSLSFFACYACSVRGLFVVACGSRSHVRGSANGSKAIAGQIPLQPLQGVQLCQRVGTDEPANRRAEGRRQNREVRVVIQVNMTPSSTNPDRECLKYSHADCWFSSRRFSSKGHLSPLLTYV